VVWKVPWGTARAAIDDGNGAAVRGQGEAVYWQFGVRQARDRRVRDVDRYHRMVAEITLPDGKVLTMQKRLDRRPST